MFVIVLQIVFDNLLGDVLLSAGVIAYLGPFTSAYREMCTDDWAKLCNVSSQRSDIVVKTHASKTCCYPGILINSV